MLTIEEIKNIRFRKANIGGYRPEDVEAFIEQVQLTLDETAKEKQELIRKLEILAKKVEEYREEEESIRHTLLSAQKLADASVREAKHKAEVILKDATMSAEQIVSDAQQQILEQKNTFESLQQEVVSFRSRLLAIYKEHLKLIDALPTEESFPKKEKTDSEESTPMDDKFENQTPTEETPNFEKVVRQVEEENEQQAGLASMENKREPENTETAGFQVDLSAVHEIEDKPIQQPAYTSRFESIKFGEDYDIEKDADEEDSPLGLFKRRK